MQYLVMIDNQQPGGGYLDSREAALERAWELSLRVRESQWDGATVQVYEAQRDPERGGPVLGAVVAAFHEGKRQPNP